MSETSNSKVAEETNSEEIASVIGEFEQYRERLLNDTLTAAKKAKLSKSQAMAQLEPQLAEIDTILQGLKDRLAGLAEVN